MEINQAYLNKFQVVTTYRYEFELICKEYEPFFGRLIWTLPYKPIPGMTNEKIRKAAEIAKKRGINKIPYLIGIIKKL